MQRLIVIVLLSFIGYQLAAAGFDALHRHVESELERAEEMRERREAIMFGEVDDDTGRD